MALKDVQELRELEDLCETLADGERKKLEKMILGRKRNLKARAEALTAFVDLCDKAALPLGAAVPGAISMMVSAGLLDDPHKLWFLVSSVLGAIVWAALRIWAYRTAVSARRDLVEIGKVD